MNTLKSPKHKNGIDDERPTRPNKRRLFFSMEVEKNVIICFRDLLWEFAACTWAVDVHLVSMRYVYHSGGIEKKYL